MGLEKWKIKNILFHIFGGIPFGEKIYYLIQKKITKSVWVDDAAFREYFQTKVSNHFDILSEFGNESICNSVFFEFGAGWDMLAPIGFALSGAKRYIAVDINNYARPELVRNTVDLYIRNIDYIKSFYEKDFSYGFLGELKRNGISREKLKDLANIEYYAPMDAGCTPFEEKSVDYVVSNVTLEHIPYNVIDSIFRECHRILKDDGIMSLTVDYSDHWQHTDNSISVYNYLKYSDKEWKKYNPSMHYQNRLRHSDYAELFKKTGFRIIHSIPSIWQEDRDKFETICISDSFKKYTKEELLLTGEHFVVMKALN